MLSHKMKQRGLHFLDIEFSVPMKLGLVMKYISVPPDPYKILIGFALGRTGGVKIERHFPGIRNRDIYRQQVIHCHTPSVYGNL